MFPFLTFLPFLMSNSNCSCQKSNHDVSITIANYEGENYVCIIPHTVEASQFISKINLIKPRAVLKPGCEHSSDKLYIFRNSFLIIDILNNSELKIYLSDNAKKDYGKY